MSDYKYRITADSGCDLSLELCESLGVLPYKMPFTMDGELMTDGMTEESFRRFYDMMRAGGVAKTSQINPGEFIDFWRPLAEAGEDVLHVSLAAAISGSCDNARSAAETLMAEHPGWHCRVVDSTNASAGFGLMVLRAVENRDSGLGAFVHGDVVHARAGAADAEQLLPEVHIVQIRRTDEQRVRVFDLGADLAAVLGQQPGAEWGDGVHGAYFKHGVQPQIPSCIPPARGRPRPAWRCISRPSCRPQGGGPLRS